MKTILKIFVLLIAINLTAQNRVLSLDGDSGYVALPQSIIDSDVFTIEAWFLIAGEGGGTNRQNFIFSQRDNATGCNHSAISLAARALPDLPNRSFAIKSDQSCYDFAVSPSEQFLEWHHIAAVKEAWSMSLYIDGELVDFTPIEQVGSYSTNIATTDIGRHRYDWEDSGLFNGSIDNLGIWSIARTESEIQGSMEAGLTGDEESLLAYWNFDDETATDLTGNGNDGLLMPGASILQCEIEPVQISVWGDMNDDGQLNISDVVILINIILSGGF